MLEIVLQSKTTLNTLQYFGTHHVAICEYVSPYNELFCCLIFQAIVGEVM